MLNLSGGKIPGFIQENLVAYMCLFAGLPGMAVHDAESFWFVSHKPAPGNSILRTRWVDDGRVEERIDSCSRRSVSRLIGLIGWCFLATRRLEARGMHGGPGGNWLDAGGWATWIAWHGGDMPGDLQGGNSTCCSTSFLGDGLVYAFRW